MKWSYKYETPPKLGDTRIVTRFALFPISWHGTTKWLQKVRIKQEYKKVPTKFFYKIDSWEDVGWADV